MNELDVLERQAAALDGEVKAETQGPQVSGSIPGGEGDAVLALPVIDVYREVVAWQGALSIFAMLARPMFPRVANLYDAKSAELAGVIAPVMVKHGWSLEALGGKWKEEIALVLVSAPILSATVTEARADIEARQLEEQAEAEGAQRAEQGEAAPVPPRPAAQKPVRTRKPRAKRKQPAKAPARIPSDS